jgi:branched-chain amino acid aminotransferase
MRVMRFDSPYDTAFLRRCVLDLAAANNLSENCYLRIQTYIDGDGAMAARGPLGMFISCDPRPATRQMWEGVHVQVSAWARLADNAAPPRVKATANYVNGRLASVQARQDGYDNALLLTAAGTVAEAPGACLFMVRHGRLITPDVADGILESITRDTLISAAREWLGQTVKQRPVGRSELYIADEIFLCGTGAEVTPVLSVDRIPVGDGKPGPITLALRATYFDLAFGRDAARPEWRCMAPRVRPRVE